MTTPIRDRPGTLGTVAFGSGGTAEVADYKPRPGASQTSLFINATQTGTVAFSRVGLGGTVSVLAGLGAVAVTGGTELRQPIAFPVNQIRIVYTNTNATAGRVTVEAIDDGNT